eukprot:Protomagalhaensia_wolfi_Nauph_80__906@NODE_1521_length_1490_cov_218_352171_g1180_i0_p1_GENE_NODE_1521_length_1490_cov_218_352171_g1180_i0NODE_1521_length_1490_cov_218_352171_g1180_i0_p1_ORF_typecomplete_len388_score50_02AOX/PF01786_17/1_2e03AOX/PF01786_17/3_6e68COQ7/PF03232_13/0_033Phage_Cox/PF10743_9/0_11_NODE_1521_length_1490_cov_218_352171_g1180_i01241164
MLRATPRFGYCAAVITPATCGGRALFRAFALKPNQHNFATFSRSAVLGNCTFTSLTPTLNQKYEFKKDQRRSVWTPSGTMMSDLDGVSTDSGALIPDAPHWRATAHGTPEKDYRLAHSVYTKEELEGVEITHLKPQGFVNRAAYSTVWLLRRVYDLATGYTFGSRDERCMVRRVVFLETVAGVPGMVGAAIRHLRSLRKMQRDYGWIHTLLEEAENERMHLMTALLLNNPGRITRAAVIGAQAGFLLWYTLMYILSPTYCHRFVGYLEEEAVKTYTTIVQMIDTGKLPGFNITAPRASQVYYQLPEDSTLRDVFMAMRADEAHHREVNHTFADLPPSAVNPFPPGY